MESRRQFLTAYIAAGVPAIFIPIAAMGQRPQPPPKPAQGGQDNQDQDSVPPKLDSKTALESNKKDIKRDIEKLFQLASDLKVEVEKTDSVQVLSMGMVKKAEEIEKLAKAIRSRAIG